MLRKDAAANLEPKKVKWKFFSSHISLIIFGDAMIIRIGDYFLQILYKHDTQLLISMTKHYIWLMSSKLTENLGKCLAAVSMKA